MTLSDNAGAALLLGAIAVVGLGYTFVGCGGPDPAPAPPPVCQVTWLEFTAADNAHQIAALTSDRVGMAQAAYDTALVLARDGGRCFDEALSVGAEASLPVLAERLRRAEAQAR